MLSEAGEDWKLKAIAENSKRYALWSKGNIWNKLPREIIEANFISEFLKKKKELFDAERENGIF